jgi:hypothetical protein
MGGPFRSLEDRLDSAKEKRGGPYLSSGPAGEHLLTPSGQPGGDPLGDALGYGREPRPPSFATYRIDPRARLQSHVSDPLLLVLCIASSVGLMNIRKELVDIVREDLAGGFRHNRGQLTVDRWYLRTRSRDRDTHRH